MSTWSALLRREILWGNSQVANTKLKASLARALDLQAATEAAAEAAAVAAKEQAAAEVAAARLVAEERVAKSSPGTNRNWKRK